MAKPGVDAQHYQQKQVRHAIRECWEVADCGQAFTAALTDQDLALAKGDQRDFVVVDPEVGLHALGKRLLGVPMPEIRERLADLENLPSIAEARESLDQQLFHRYQATPLDIPERVPTESLGPDPQADRFKPFVREPFALAEPEGAPVLGAAIADVAGAVADVADVFSGGAATSSTPAPLRAPAPEPEKPRHDPREDAARTLNTVDRDFVPTDPATQAAFATDPGAATPNLAQQIHDRWRREREKDRDIER